MSKEFSKVWWWVDRLPGKDAYGLFMVQYVYEKGKDRPTKQLWRQGHGVDSRWVEGDWLHGPEEPWITLTGLDAMHLVRGNRSLIERSNLACKIAEFFEKRAWNREWRKQRSMWWGEQHQGQNRWWQRRRHAV